MTGSCRHAASEPRGRSHPIALRGLGRSAVAGALALAALAACGQSVQTTQATGVAAVLRAAPTALPILDPAAFHQLLEHLRGKPVVVNIWASWCGPCVTEAPVLAREARAFAGRVQFLGVDVLDQRGPAEAFIRRFGWTYPSVFDPTAAIRNDLGFVGQPVTALYDSTGERVFVWSGPLEAGVLGKELASVT